MTTDNKHEIRERIKTLLNNQGEEDRLNKSLRICDKLLENPEFINSKIILFYASFKGEVNTFEIMKRAQRQGKKIGLPKIIPNENRLVPYLVDSLEEDLLEGTYGIKEPKEKQRNRLKVKDIDCVVVPGVAFSKDGHRLGRGGGYYDRFLSAFSKKIPLIGLAFDFQIVENLPEAELHDVPVSFLITN